MSHGLAALQHSILAAGQCTTCGACVGLCPYLTHHRGRVVRLHDCDLAQGRCYEGCPRTRSVSDALQAWRHGPGAEQPPHGCGPFREALIARAGLQGVRERGQDGATVSSLLARALDDQLVEAAIVHSSPDGIGGEGAVVRTRGEVLACAGSRYAAGPVLSALNRAAGSGLRRAALVGVPCQLQGWACMDEDRRDRVALTIGLFCTWAFDLRALQEALGARLAGQRVARWTITPPPSRCVQAQVGGQTHEVPLDRLRGCIQPACGTCFDMTSELADVSVGSVETRVGWNAMLIRTRAGSDLVRRAVDAGELQVQPMPEDVLTSIGRASLGKKLRARDAADALGAPALAPGFRERLQALEEAAAR